jgi:glycopeptide antibiotics resistance protein
LQVVVLNVIFFMPLGFLVRYLFGWGVARAALSGLVVSLAVASTQLTPIRGFHPCSYRLFSLTDLTHNPLGAVIGSLIALALLRRRQALAPSAAEPRPVTVGRRLLGMLSDVLVFALVSLIAGLVVSLLRMLVIAPGSPTARPR